MTAQPGQRSVAVGTGTLPLPAVGQAAHAPAFLTGVQRVRKGLSVQENTVLEGAIFKKEAKKKQNPEMKACFRARSAFNEIRYLDI